MQCIYSALVGMSMYRFTFSNKVELFKTARLRHTDGIIRIFKPYVGIVLVKSYLTDWLNSPKILFTFLYDTLLLYSIVIVFCQQFAILVYFDTIPMRTITFSNFKEFIHLWKKTFETYLDSCDASQELFHLKELKEMLKRRFFLHYQHLIGVRFFLDSLNLLPLKLEPIIRLETKSCRI